MKLLSDASECGLRAVIWLAQRPGQTRKVREIAAGTSSAPGYPMKMLLALTKADILSAQRGSHGGFTLKRDPSTLSVLEVINAIDPIERIHTCPLRLDDHCGYLCPMHKPIDDAIAAVEASFAASTIQDMFDSCSHSRPLCDASVLKHSQEPSSQEVSAMSMFEGGPA